MLDATLCLLPHSVPSISVLHLRNGYAGDRFSDGTQVCWGTTTMSKSNVSGINNFEYFNQLYGAAFKNNDYYLSIDFIKNTNSNSQISEKSMIIYIEKPGSTWNEQHSWRDASGFHINQPAYNQTYPSSFQYYSIGRWK